MAARTNTCSTLTALTADDIQMIKHALEDKKAVCSFCGADGRVLEAATGTERGRDAMRNIFMPCEGGHHVACGDCAKTKSKLVELVEDRRTGACHLKCLGADGTCRSRGIFPPPKMPAWVVALNAQAKIAADQLEELRQRKIAEEQLADRERAREAAIAALQPARTRSRRTRAQWVAEDGEESYLEHINAKKQRKEARDAKKLLNQENALVVGYYGEVHGAEELAKFTAEAKAAAARKAAGAGTSDEGMECGECLPEEEE